MVAKCAATTIVAFGTGTSFSVTSRVTASVPSLPHNTRARLAFRSGSSPSQL